MPKLAKPLDAEVVHELPNELMILIGNIMVAYAKLEHKLTMLVGVILQLNRTEARIALREPRASDRLDMALDLVALKGIELAEDTRQLKETLTKTTSGRDVLAHGIWLEHPETKQLFLRLTRGTWPKELTLGDRISRTVVPQSVPYGPGDCKQTLDLIAQSIAGIDRIGAELDSALQTFPERFRQPAPVLNPLGARSRKGK